MLVANLNPSPRRKPKRSLHLFRTAGRRSDNSAQTIKQEGKGTQKEKKEEKKENNTTKSSVKGPKKPHQGCICHWDNLRIVFAAV